MAPLTRTANMTQKTQISQMKERRIDVSTHPVVVTPVSSRQELPFCSPVGVVGNSNIDVQSLPHERQRRANNASSPVQPTSHSLPPPPPLLEMIDAQPTMEGVTKSSTSTSTSIGETTPGAHAEVKNASSMTASAFDRRERRRRALVVATWRRRLHLAGSNPGNNNSNNSSRRVGPSAFQRPMFEQVTTVTSIEEGRMSVLPQNPNIDTQQQQRHRRILPEQDLHIPSPPTTSRAAHAGTATGAATADNTENEDTRATNTTTAPFAYLSDRRVMRNHVCSLISHRIPTNMSRRLSRSKFLKEWAFVIETCLYKTCASVEEYADLDTLERRVAVVSAAVSRRQEQQQYELLRGRQRSRERWQRRVTTMQQP